MELFAAVLLCLAGRNVPLERVVERSGAILTVADGRLFRERDGARVELGCTDARGPGRVLDLALDPAGLVFVAAERGLFLLGPSVELLDPVELLEGAPPGPPTSVFVDRQRRLWLATADEIGVLDPSFFWGRTLALGRGSGGGPYRVSGTAGGGVVCASPTGTWDLDAFLGDGPPRVTRLAVDGLEVTHGSVVRRAAGGELVLDVAGEASGGPTFRYRIDHHHVWRPLVPGAALAVPNPGKRTLEVVALDQVLRRSEPLLVKLEIGYPFYYGGRFVVGAVACAAALALAVFLFRGRAREGRFRPGRALVSTGLLIALALQGIAGLEPHAKGWPFVGFGMYTEAHREDEIIYDEQLVALRVDGSEFPIRPQGTGVVIDEIWQVARPLIDGGEPALRAFLADWRGRFPSSGVVGLQVQARRARLTRTGPVPIAPLVLAHYEEASDG